MVDHRQKDVVAAVGGGCSGYMCKDAGAPQRNATLEAKTERPEKTRHAANGTS